MPVPTWMQRSYPGQIPNAYLPYNNPRRYSKSRFGMSAWLEKAINQSRGNRKNTGWTRVAGQWGRMERGHFFPAVPKVK